MLSFGVCGSHTFCVLHVSLSDNPWQESELGWHLPGSVDLVPVFVQAGLGNVETVLFVSVREGYHILWFILKLSLGR